MKYFYLFLGCILFILITILYFQLLAGAVFPVLFFTKYISISVWTLFVVLLSMLSGTFLTLGITGILNNNDSLDEGFDL